jgi:hypothetical protein
MIVDGYVDAVCTPTTPTQSAPEQLLLQKEIVLVLVLHLRRCFFLCFYLQPYPLQCQTTCLAKKKRIRTNPKVLTVNSLKNFLVHCSKKVAPKKPFKMKGCIFKMKDPSGIFI